MKLTKISWVAFRLVAFLRLLARYGPFCSLLLTIGTFEQFQLLIYNINSFIKSVKWCMFTLKILTTFSLFLISLHHDQISHLTMSHFS